eukprot:TRINITY_DN5344_c0_g1_i4.p1 TRINITY_DN5344_c0_g1~~TRINITY_DN5344_c0_g1_i4.p1  ORF type:complete len:332 (+),score=43.78 TRINITY_DN5344_c0_g1_i4:203-1198(+)
MLTGWPADPSYEYNMITWRTKVVFMGCAVGGVFLFALLADYLHSALQLTSDEKLIYKWHKKKKSEDNIRIAAATLIQVVWRHHRWKQIKRMQRTGIGGPLGSLALSSADLASVARAEQLRFNNDLVICVRKFQEFRRAWYVDFGADTKYSFHEEHNKNNKKEKSTNIVATHQPIVGGQPSQTPVPPPPSSLVPDSALAQSTIPSTLPPKTKKNVTWLVNSPSPKPHTQKQQHSRACSVEPMLFQLPDHTEAWKERQASMYHSLRQRDMSAPAAAAVTAVVAQSLAALRTSMLGDMQLLLAQHKSVLAQYRTPRVPTDDLNSTHTTPTMPLL